MYPCQVKVLLDRIVKQDNSESIDKSPSTTGLKCTLCRCGTYAKHRYEDTIPELEVQAALEDMCSTCCKYQKEVEIRTGWIILPDVDYDRTTGRIVQWDKPIIPEGGNR